MREKDILRVRKRHPSCEKKISSVRKKTSSVREELFHDPRQQPNRGNLTYHAPPCGGGEGGGASWDGVVASWGWTIARHLLPSTPTLFYKECQLFPLSKYYPYLCLRMLTET